MVIAGIVAFFLAFIAGLFSTEIAWLENVAVFLFGWAVAFIMLGMASRDGVDTDSETR